MRDAPLFTVYLKHVGEQNNGYGGLYTYGAVDTANCGAVTSYVPLSSATYFQFRMAAASAGNYFSQVGWNVISNTGMSMIGAPQAIADGISHGLNATWSYQHQTYYVNCNVKETINVQIGPYRYSIQPENYLMRISSSTCILALFPMDNGGFGPQWSLGTPFIRQFCNIYDIGQKRIGFAPSKQ